MVKSVLGTNQTKNTHTQKTRRYAAHANASVPSLHRWVQQLAASWDSFHPAEEIVFDSSEAKTDSNAFSLNYKLFSKRP